MIREVRNKFKYYAKVFFYIISKIKQEVITITLGLILSWFFYLFPASYNRINEIQNNLITVAGIFSAFAISFLISKIFAIKDDRGRNRPEIIALSKRLTAFRRLLYFVLSNRKFWIEYSLIQEFKRDYPELNYWRLVSGRDELSKEFCNSDQGATESSARIYTAMEALYGEIEDEFSLYEAYQNNSVGYTVEQLQIYYYPCNE
jgi:hypothetical protein